MLAVKGSICAFSMICWRIVVVALLAVSCLSRNVKNVELKQQHRNAKIKQGRKEVKELSHTHTHTHRVGEPIAVIDNVACQLASRSGFCTCPFLFKTPTNSRLHPDAARCNWSSQPGWGSWCGWPGARTCAGGYAMALALAGWQHWGAWRHSAAWMSLCLRAACQASSNEATLCGRPLNIKWAGGLINLTTANKAGRHKRRLW